MNPLITTPPLTHNPAAAAKTQAGQSPRCFFLARVIVANIALVISAAALLNPARAEFTYPSTAQLRIEERNLRIYAARSYLSELRRAERVTYSLLQAATPYCVSRRKYSVGVPPLSARDLPTDLRLGFLEWVATDRLDAMRFMHVHPFTPLARAGVQEGDILISMTDRATGKQVIPGWVFNRPASALVSNAPIALEIERGKTSILLMPTPQLICDVQLRLLRTEKVIARADAGTLTISTGLLRFLPGDDELAFLLTNELMHDQFRLARTARTKVKLSTSVGASSPYPQNEEYQADYLGAYLVATAGFNLIQANDVWRRLAIQPANETRNDIVVRHPLSAVRSVHLTAVIEEIRRKKQAGERIVPENQDLLPLAMKDFTISDSTNLNPDLLPKRAIEENSRLHSITNIPFIDNVGVAGYQRFLDTPLRPRAFAIGPNKRQGGGAWSYKTGANATADALAHCSLLARGPCYLYAIDDQVVWNAETAQDQPESKQASVAGALIARPPPATNFATIDDLAAVPLPESEIPRYRAFLEKPSPRAFIITQRGVGRYWVGLAAMHDALAYCARMDEPCWLYAVNDAVVWSADPAKRIASRDQLPAETEESGLLEK